MEHSTKRYDDYISLQEEAESDTEEPWRSEISNWYHEWKGEVGKFIENVKENEKDRRSMKKRREIKFQQQKKQRRKQKRKMILLTERRPLIWKTRL